MNFNIKIIFILLAGMFVKTNIIYSDYKVGNSKNRKATEKTEKVLVTGEIEEVESIAKKENFANLDEKFISDYKFEEGYKITVKYIKEKESFINKKYLDAAGIETIGYGHLILETDSFPNTITEKQADRLLRKDLDEVIKAVEKETNLKGYKKLAIAHFVYMFGIGNFNKSNLKKLIKENKPIDKEMLKWCYYQNTKGEMVKSNYLYKIRQWEIDMYNK